MSEIDGIEFDNIIRFARMNTNPRPAGAPTMAGANPPSNPEQRAGDDDRGRAAPARAPVEWR